MIECIRTAREELLLRVKHRDDWLKLQLLAQITLLALAGGVRLGGVEASGPLPIVVALSVPVSFVLASLYFVEDRLIGHLSKYIGQLSNDEARLSSSTEIIPNWDISKELREYARNTLPFRAMAQLATFVIVPAGLSILRIGTFGTSWTNLQIAEVAINSILWLATFGIAVQVFKSHRRRGQGTADASAVRVGEGRPTIDRTYRSKQ